MHRPQLSTLPHNFGGRTIFGKDGGHAHILATAGWGCDSFFSWTVLVPPPGLALRSNRRLSGHRKASLEQTRPDFRPALPESVDGSERRSRF